MEKLTLRVHVRWVASLIIYFIEYGIVEFNVKLRNNDIMLIQCELPRNTIRKIRTDSRFKGIDKRHEQAPIIDY